MRKSILSFLFLSLYLLFTESSIAQEIPKFEWAKSFGGSGAAGEQIVDLKIDASGNTYVTGYFTSTTDFDPSAGIFSLTPVAGVDIFVAKFNPAGNFVWAKGIGGNDPQDERANALDVDNAGNVYITGLYFGTVDFDPGAGITNLTSVGSADQFILKLNTNGDFVWARSVGGLQLEEGLDIAVDNSGNVFTTGDFFAMVDFDPGAGTVNLTPASFDAFVLKLDVNGNYQWVKHLGNTELEEGRKLALDGTGNVIITGGLYDYATPFDFDPGPATVMLTPHPSTSQWDIFICELNSSTGDILWAKTITGTLWDRDEGITIDNLDNILLTGYFQGTIDLDPGTGISNVSAVGQRSPFIVKLNSTGDFVWGKTLPNTSAVGAPDSRGDAITTDPAGNVYASGQFQRTIDFDPGVGVFNLTSVGQSDVYVTKFDATGNFVWAYKIGGTNFDFALGIAATAGEVYVGGSFALTSDFDPGTCLFNMTSSGGYDAYIQKVTFGAPVPDPTISSFSPTAGPIGTSVTLTGTNFDTTPANNAVTLNGTAAVVTASTATSITTTVPAGATTGKISVTVNCFPVLSATDFTVTAPSAINFITRWNLATAGSGPTQLSFSTATSGSVNYTWQEISPGSASGSGSWIGTTLTITGLPTGATIRLQIAPTNFQRVIIDNGLDANRLTQVEQWGSTAWTSMQSAFYDCQNLQITATDVPNLSGVTNMEEMFSGCITLNSPSNMGSWNTATVTNMRFLFYGATAFNQNIGGWNTGAVTNMSTMFSEAAAFNQDIGSWNTGAVTDMSGMFQYAYAFNQNIGSWNTSAVTDMSSMFSRADSFNQNIAAWNTGAATDMRSMFRLAIAFNQNIGAWTLPSTVDIRNMFDDSGMDCTNYSATLIGWSANPSTPNGRTLGAIGRQYGTNAIAARTNLTTTKGWTITGDTPSGAVCSSASIPTITSFTPSSGPVGTTVTITGTNFSTTPGNNTVLFNGVAAVVTASTSTSITVTVPSGATTGKISITVGGNTATSGDDFTVSSTTNQPPVIESTTTAVPIEGLVTLDLEPLISDPDSNLDPNSLYLVNSVSEQGASASLDGTFILTLDYGGVQFFGTDRITIGVCDLLTECAEEDLTIEVGGDIIVYNAISPHGDGTNDILLLQYIDVLPDTEKNHITIYNRWGDVVFEISNYNNTDRVFKGQNNNGNDLPTGIYFYKIEFSAGRKIKTGYLSLKR